MKPFSFLVPLIAGVLAGLSQLAAIQLGAGDGEIVERVYVTNFDSDFISVIDTSSLKMVRSIPVGIDPNWIEFTSNGRYAYVSNTASADVSVIDTTWGRVISTIGVGKSPKRLLVAHFMR